MNLEVSPQLPTDRQESEILELKSLAALDKPETIARGAVAMLNSKVARCGSGSRRVRRATRSNR